MTELPTILPAADDFALASRATPLGGIIAREIEARGRITFAEFMALALGHPEHGYYSRAQLAWGADGDYETSPEVSPVFGYLWARQVVECWERLGRPPSLDLIELGAGSGAFASALLGWLHERAPECAAAVRPVLLDGHPHRLAQQRSRLASLGIEAEHALLDDWLAGGEAITGIVISNEFFDALPVHLVERRDSVLHEWYVTTAAHGGLALALGEASTPALTQHFERLGLWPGEECRAEVSLAAADVMRAIAGRMRRGYMLVIDYGHEAAALYAPWRRMGTLMAFRRHSPQPDPLAMPGLTDLTAHVDFTSLAVAAAGFEAAPLVSQAEALVALGIGEALHAARDRAAEDLAGFANARRQVETLLDPAGLGRIKVLVQAKDADLNGLRCLRGVAP